MNTTKLRFTAVALVIGALVTVIVWQEGRAKRLMADADVLREQVGQLTALREERERLSEQVRLASERSKADASELARLRGQSARMRQVEQESARPKAERDRSSKQPTPSSPTVPDEQTQEWPLAQARMRFSKVLGLSLRMFASDHQGQVPTNVQAAISALREGEFVEMLADQMPPEAVAHDIRADQFELVFQGSVDATGRPPGSTIIARSKEPVQLSNGRWARATVFDDGHGEVFVADTRDELVAKEKKWMQTQTTP